MRTVAEALEIVMMNVPAMPAEKVDIGSACGRVLAAAMTSPLFHPPADNSAMDGFAVRWEDVAGASKENPIVLRVVENIRAGSSPGAVIGKGEATSIMTGASIPAGADTVIRIEDTDRSRGERIAIHAAGKKGQDIRLRGENIKAGDLVYDRGTIIGPAEVGMFALMGKPIVPVYRRPTVAILVTGDEIRDLDDPAVEEKITNSNGYALAAQVVEAGGIPALCGIAADNRETLAEKLKEALRADVAITSGGVSMGYHDYVKEVLQELGVKIEFWRVNMRPGHPIAFGRMGDKPVFGLPGNPVSAMVCFEQFARPLIRAMGGHRKPYRPVVEAVLDETLFSKRGRKNFARGILFFAGGEYRVASAGSQGSGILLSMSRANALVILPDEGGEFPAGSRVKVQMLGRQDAGQEAPGY